MASAGIGSAPHMYWELFRNLTGVDMLHVPYRGGGPAVTDLLGGQVQVYFGTSASSIEHIKAEKLRALAVTTAARVAVLPDIPAMAEFLPSYDASIYVGIVAPRSTPTEIISTLNQEINLALTDQELRGGSPSLATRRFRCRPPNSRKLIADETEKWGKVIRAANIRPE